MTFLVDSARIAKDLTGTCDTLKEEGGRRAAWAWLVVETSLRVSDRDSQVNRGGSRGSLEDQFWMRCGMMAGPIGRVKR